MEFNEKLQELRKGKGLTQEELAQEIFVSRTAVSKWESGRGYPNIDSLKELAAFFSIIFTALLLFIPVFGNGEGEQSASLFEMSGTQLWIRIVFAVVISLTVLNGVCGLIISRFDKPLWNKHRFVTGIALSVIACLLFIITRQPYAGVFCFAILMIKGWLLLRRKS